jgi:hypothetical protein
VLQEIQKLSPKHYIRTDFTVARIRYKDDVREIIVPVDHYQQGDTGFEVIAVEIIAAHCPWDMEQTYLTIDTEHTHIIDQRLMDMVEVDPAAHKVLKDLDTVTIDVEPNYSCVTDEISSLRDRVKELEDKLNKIT